MTNFSLIFLLICLNVAFADSTPRQSAPPSPAKGKQYAVLLAHASGYNNYWSQANIFHAYHSLVKNGVDPHNIIVFATNDTAHHPDNPFPGQLFTSPAGHDVYKGVKIDYKYFDPEIFLAALKGDKKRAYIGDQTKVLTSTANDNVFIYSVGHGSVGSLIIDIRPYRLQQLYGDDLVDAFKFMYRNKMYKRLVYYMSACYSGSMFVTLPQDINVYVTTSSEPDKVSYKHYCFGDDTVKGKEIGTCLTDQYSINFLTFMDVFNLHEASLEDQFNFTQANTWTNKVMRYGSQAMLSDSVANYQSDPKKYNGKNKLNIKLNRVDWPELAHLTHLRTPSNFRHGLVEQSNSKRMYLEAKQKRNPSKETMRLLMEETAFQTKVDMIFKQIKAKFGLNVKTFVKKVNFKCLKARMNFYTETCGPLNEYGLKYSNFIHQTCIQNVKDDAYEFGIKMICSKKDSAKSKKLQNKAVKSKQNIKML